MVTVPAINLNGTAPEDLFNQVMAALEATRNAYRLMLEACPNGRDYQTAIPGTASAALQQHSLRLERLQRIERELKEIVEHVQAVIDYKAEIASRG